MSRFLASSVLPLRPGILYQSAYQGFSCPFLHTFSTLNFFDTRSMEPVFFRGDILIASGWKAPNYQEGDIVMWQLEKSPMIVHRIIKRTEQNNYLTKGDNNQADDIGLYQKACSLLLFSLFSFFYLPLVWTPNSLRWPSDTSN